MRKKIKSQNEQYKEKGLKFIGVWVAPEDEKKIRASAKRLRKAAGLLLPRD